LDELAVRAVQADIVEFVNRLSLALAIELGLALAAVNELVDLAEDLASDLGQRGRDRSERELFGSTSF
jgi:hypothetical protein